MREQGKRLGTHWMRIMVFLHKADANISKIRAIVCQGLQSFVGHVRRIDNDLLQHEAPFRHSSQAMLRDKSSFVLLDDQPLQFCAVGSNFPQSSVPNDISALLTPNPTHTHRCQLSHKRPTAVHLSNSPKERL
jgi:hypothetical protein